MPSSLKWFAVVAVTEKLPEGACRMELKAESLRLPHRCDLHVADAEGRRLAAEADAEFKKLLLPHSCAMLLLNCRGCW